MEYHRKTSRIIKNLSCPLLSICVVGAENARCPGQPPDAMGVLGVSPRPTTRALTGWTFCGSTSHTTEEKIQEIEHILFTTERPRSRNGFSRTGKSIFEKRHRALADRSATVRWSWFVRVSGQRTGGNKYPWPLRSRRRIVRVAKGYLTGAFVFGQIAAEKCSKFCRLLAAPKIDTSKSTGLQTKSKSGITRIEKQCSMCVISNTRCAG